VGYITLRYSDTEKLGDVMHCYIRMSHIFPFLWILQSNIKKKPNLKGFFFLKYIIQDIPKSRIENLFKKI
jgi:hypothetical protein